MPIHAEMEIVGWVHDLKRISWIMRSGTMGESTLVSKRMGKYLSRLPGPGRAPHNYIILKGRIKEMITDTLVVCQRRSRFRGGR